MPATLTANAGSPRSSRRARPTRRIAALVAAGTALAVGASVLVAAPASAAVDTWDKKANALKGSMSSREFSKVYRALAKQKCVTPKEVDKIAKAKHKYAGTAGKKRKVYMWDGRKADNTRYYSLIFTKKKCLVYGEPTLFHY
jgi:hypothetical protein